MTRLDKYLLPIILLIIVALALTSDNSKVLPEKEEVVLYGKIHSRLTYGRGVFENLTEGKEYEYFIVEPDDYTEEGARKYSPKINSLSAEEIVKITGKIANKCWWNDTTDLAGTYYKGCVPWIDSEKIETVDVCYGTKSEIIFMSNDEAKNCLVEYLEELESEVEHIQNYFITKLTNNRATADAQDEWSTDQDIDLINSLPILHNNWINYRDDSCEFQNSSYLYGSGHSAFVMRCQIEYTKDYINMLKTGMEDWSIDYDPFLPI